MLEKHLSSRHPRTQVGWSNKLGMRPYPMYGWLLLVLNYSWHRLKFFSIKGFPTSVNHQLTIGWESIDVNKYAFAKPHFELSNSGTFSDSLCNFASHETAMHQPIWSPKTPKNLGWWMTPQDAEHGEGVQYLGGHGLIGQEHQLLLEVRSWRPWCKQNKTWQVKS